MSTTTKIPKDNFTRTPNIFFALIRTMSEAELRVMAVAIRKILGWNREKPEPLSKSQFMEWTGMTKKSVTKGINEAIQRGWLILVDCNGERGCARYTLNMDIADWFKPIEETCEEDMDEGDTKYPSDAENTMSPDYLVSQNGNTKYPSQQPEEGYVVSPQKKALKETKKINSASSPASDSSVGNLGASDTPSAHLSTSSKVVGYTTTTTRVSATSSSITASENALTEEKARTGLIAWLNDNFCQIYAPIQSILEKTIVIVDTRTGDEVIEQCAIDRYDSDPDFRKFVVERAKKYREMAKGAGEPVSKYARRMANTLRGVNIDDWGYHDWKREARKEGKIETPAPKTDILYIPEE